MRTAKYAKHAKKKRMQRNTKYRMQFNHGKNPEYTEGMQRQIWIDCISSCLSSPSCPKDSGIFTQKYGEF